MYTTAVQKRRATCPNKLVAQERYRSAASNYLCKSTTLLKVADPSCYVREQWPAPVTRGTPLRSRLKRAGKYMHPWPGTCTCRPYYGHFIPLVLCDQSLRFIPVLFVPCASACAAEKTHTHTRTHTRPKTRCFGDTFWSFSSYGVFTHI